MLPYTLVLFVYVFVFIELMSSNRGSVGALVRNSLFNIKLRFDSSLSPLSLSTSRKFRLSTLKQNSAENDSDRKKRNRKPTKDDDVHITNSEHSNSVQTDPNSIQNDFVVKGLKSFEVDHECHFIVFGAPVALQRHRSTKSGHMYNPSKKMQDLFSVACSSVLPSKPLEGPLEAKLIFYFARPKSHFGSGKKSAVLKPNTSVWHTSKKGTVE